MQSLKEATLVKGKGIVGDRYEQQTGTYSAGFLSEPGKNLTLMSADGVEAKVSETKMKPFESLGELRRNLVVRGLTAEAVNEMVGHEVQVGGARLFVHRRTVPCKYREAQCKRPHLMNNLWDVCGVNCEVIDGGVVNVGDEVAIIPNTHQPKRANPGHKPPGFFTKPAERSAAQVKGMAIPPLVAFIMCLSDPAGFQRLEDGYNSAGQHFWSPKAYKAGQVAAKWRIPILLGLPAVLLACLASLIRVSIY